MAGTPYTPSTPLSAEDRPVARVLPLLGLVHLDRVFDYLIKQKHSESVQVGVRVRVRFGGRLVDGLVVERRSTTTHEGRLSYIERVISPDPVYTPQIATLVDKLATRYAATRSDIIRAAIPARHAGAESADTSTAWEDLGKVEEPDLSPWALYEHGQSFVDAVLNGSVARCAWQIAPGDDWARALMALAVKVVKDGHGALIIAPDQKEVDRLEAAARELVAAKQVTVLSASLGAQARYRRFLSVLKGQSRLVIGTRSAAFAPVKDLQLCVILGDGDSNLVEPRAPYHHAREVLTTRSVIEECSLILAGHSRTAEVQLLVNAGWAHDLVAARTVVRARSPLIRAAADSDFERMRDPHAATARIPRLAYELVRSTLDRDKPVIVQVPRKGYIPTLACRRCRHPARCRACNGPLSIPDTQGPGAPACGWCGRPETNFHCQECGSTGIRAVVLGASRTAEELGRAFANTRVIASGGNKIHEEIPPGPSLVVATPGAQPRIADGSRYGAALLLDAWALLGRQDLRATEETLARWMQVATNVDSAEEGGGVFVSADPSLPVVQHLIRWDPIAAAQAELSERAEVGFPPVAHMAAVDGPASSIERFRGFLELPDSAELLGPVPLPPGQSIPGAYDEQAYGPPERLLVRVPLAGRAELGKRLRAALIQRAGHKDDLPLRIQVDPVHIG